MRIAYICADRGVPPGGRGGSATHVREMVRALVARGIDITVLTAAAEGAAAALPCPVVDLQSGPLTAELRSRIAKAAHADEGGARAAHESYSLLLNSSLAAALETMSPAPDIIYERHSLWSIAGLAAARRHGIPYVLEVNAPLVEQQRQYRELGLAATAEAVEGLLFEHADRVLVTSAALVEYARGRGASRRAVRVLPCGVSAQMLAEPDRDDRTGANQRERFVVGFVGSLKPWHGIDVLLRAFRKLHRLHMSYRLLVVGDGPLREEMERYLRVNGLDVYADIVGSVDPSEVPKYLARMDVGVAPYPSLPSFYFSPLKIWEYAAAGVPIAASESGDLPRLFPHKVAALLHPPGSASKLAAHIELLRTDPQVAARLTRRARQVARAHTWDRLAARLDKIAADLLRTHRRLPQ